MVCLSQQKDYTTISFPDTNDFCLSKQKELLHTTSKISMISVHPRSKTLVITTLKYKHKKGKPADGSTSHYREISDTSLQKGRLTWSPMVTNCQSSSSSISLMSSPGQDKQTTHLQSKKNHDSLFGQGRGLSFCIIINSENTTVKILNSKLLTFLFFFLHFK